MKKKLTSIALLYIIQLVAAACDPCECGPARTFERSYNGLDLSAWDTSGFQNVEVSDSAYRHSFGLTVSVEFDLSQISARDVRPCSGTLGISYALSCDCVPDEYIEADPINALEITVTNTEGQVQTVVTDSFTTYGYSGERMTIDELLDERAEWHDGFQLDLTQYEGVPNASIFTVKVILESGAELTAQTGKIFFK